MLLAILLSAAATDTYLDQTRPRWEQVSQKLWEFSETALQEKKSAALFEELLEKEGFQVQRGVGQLPTAFVASAGSGEPVVAILAEYDALPELSQHGGEPRKDPLTKGAPGHGCGHNLLGTAAVAAAVAANRERMEKKLPGTLQVFGTPAEEILIGKTFMLMAGAFKKTDVVLSWHPGDKNEIVNGKRLALTASEVEFFGKTAHAAASPWLGRSSLDALELFEHAMSLMREHIQPTARIHRVIKNGGVVANIIPDYAKVQVWLRDANGQSVDEMLGRMRKAAEGAALGTETRAQVSVLASVRDPVSNQVLGQVMQKELERVGAPKWDAADEGFARSLQKEVGVPEAGLASDVTPYGVHGATASSDIGEVSAAVPLAELGVATRPLGTASHHWATTSCSLHPVGLKGMSVASKVLAGSLVNLLQQPATVASAKAEFAKATKGKAYQSPLPADAKPVVF